MRVGFIQFNPELGLVNKNIETVESMLDKIEADALLLPELFATGYLFPDRDFIKPMAESAGKGPIFDAMYRWAKKINGLVCGGFPEIDGNKIYNTALAVEPSGKYHLYRKIHLFDREKLYFDPGSSSPEPFTFRDVKFGILICFDWIFPEIYRVLMLQGTQVVLHPSNLVLPYCQRASYARAVENRFFIIMTNRIGVENLETIHLHFTGESIIYSPSGEILAKAPKDDAIVKIADIDPEDALNKIVTDHNHIIDDRRPELYRRICTIQ